MTADSARCVDCGRASCDGRCHRPLDPPRFCGSCGHRLIVTITPVRVDARCRKDAGHLVERSAPDPPGRLAGAWPPVAW